MLTSNAGEELSGKALNLAVRKWHKLVALEKIEYTLTKQIHDNTNVASVVETIPKMYAAVSVFVIIGFESRQYPEFYS